MAPYIYLDVKILHSKAYVNRREVEIRTLLTFFRYVLIYSESGISVSVNHYQHE